MKIPPEPSRGAARLQLEEHLRRLPANAAIKGLYFQGTIELARRAQPGFDAPKAAGIPARRYVSFFDYPYGDFLKLNVACARALHPALPPGEGVKRVAWHAYDMLLGSQVGRVIFGVFGRSFEQIALMGGRGYAVSLNFGEVLVTRVAERHVRYEFRDTPAFLDTMQVGVVEGGMRFCGVTGEVGVTLKDIANAVFDITWR